MKKNYLVIVVLFILSVQYSKAQVTIYSENFGGAGTTTLPPLWTSATGDWVVDPNINNGGGVPPCTLALSSGNSVLAGSDGNSSSESAVSEPFSTIGRTSLVVNYNAYRSTGAPSVTLEVSSDNVTYVAIPGWSDVVADDAWHAINQFTLPATMENQSSVYLRWSYPSTFNGFFFAYDDLIVKATSTPIFYWNGVGALNLLTSWGANTNGSGTQPSSFTLNNQAFFIVNGSAATLVAPWTIGGTGTVLHVGSPSGTVSVNFTIPTTNALTLSGAGKLTVNNQGTLTLQNTSFPTLSQVNLNTGSTVDYAQVSPVTLWAGVHHNVIISGGAQKNQLGNITVNGNLNLNGFNFNMSNSSLNSLTLNGTISGSGQLLTGNSRLIIGGTGTFGTITFGVGATSRSINQLTYNRASGGVVTLGSGLTVVSTASIINGRLNLNGNLLSLTGTSVTLHSSIANGDFGGSKTSSLSISGAGTTLNGTLFMDQTSATTRALNDLILNRTAGQTLTLGNAIEIWGSLTPSVGTVASGGNVTVKSDANNKGRIGIISASGDFTGNTTVESFAAAGTTGWTNLTSNGVTGQSFTNWNDDFAITCPTCPDGSSVGGVLFTSVYEYDETLSSVSFSDAAHYVELLSIGAAIDSKKGYWVYLGNGPLTTSDIVIDNSGAINKKNLSNMNVTVTGGAGPQTGFNLLGNPYPSPISFTTALGANLANTDGILYVWNPDLSGGQGDHATFASGSGVSSPAVGSGGVNNNIPLGQGFQIHASSAFVLSPTENWKSPTNSQNALLKSSSVASTQQLFRLQLSGQSFNTETVIHMHPNATMGIDKGFDAISLSNEYIANSSALIYSTVNNQKLKINSINPVVNTVTISMSVESPINGQYAIIPIDMSLMPAGACISLFDNVTATTHNLRSGAYNFTFNADGINRFVITITINATNLTTSLTPPVCTKQTTGKLIAGITGVGNYNYIWKDENGTVVRNVNSTLTTDTLKNVGVGNYAVEVAKVSACQSGNANFVVQATAAKPNALFTASSNTVFINAANSVLFTDNSTNASTYAWDFGDNTNASTANVNHAFTTVGNYDVRLIVTNGACADSSTYSLPITAINSPIGIKEVTLNNYVNAYYNGHNLMVDFNFEKDTKVNVSITNILGQRIVNSQKVLVKKDSMSLSIPQGEQLIFVTIETNEARVTKKIIVNN